MIDAYARMVGLMGPAGSGQLTKMINQICIAGLVQGLAEGIHFGKKAGLDIEKVIEVISKGAAGSWQMENRHKTMNAGKYDFGFAVDWMRKDLGICLDEADRNGARLAGHGAGRSVLRRRPGDGRQALGHLVAAGTAGEIAGRDGRAHRPPPPPPRLSRICARSARRRTGRACFATASGLIARSAFRTACSAQIARRIKRNHERAFELWATGIMEAQFIASVTADPKRLTAEDARKWAASFDSLGHCRWRLGPFCRYRRLA